MTETINISSQVGSSICNNFGKYQYSFPFLLAIPFETYFISDINCRYTHYYLKSLPCWYRYHKACIAWAHTRLVVSLFPLFIPGRGPYTKPKLSLTCLINDVISVSKNWSTVTNIVNQLPRTGFITLNRTYGCQVPINIEGCRGVQLWQVTC
jgi:hypothetical protein